MPRSQPGVAAPSFLSHAECSLQAKGPLSLVQESQEGRGQESRTRPGTPWLLAGETDSAKLRGPRPFSRTPGRRQPRGPTPSRPVPGGLLAVTAQRGQAWHSRPGVGPEAHTLLHEGTQDSPVRGSCSSKRLWPPSPQAGTAQPLRGPKPGWTSAPSSTAAQKGAETCGPPGTESAPTSWGSPGPGQCPACLSREAAARSVHKPESSLTGPQARPLSGGPLWRSLAHQLGHSPQPPVATSGGLTCKPRGTGAPRGRPHPGMFLACSSRDP